MFANRYPEIVIPAPEDSGSGQRETTGKWHVAGPPIRGTQGWKLYVSAVRPFFLETLEAARRVFAAHDVSYKYVSSDRVLRKINAGLYGYSQIGKLIIAYFDSSDDPGPVVVALKGALERFRHRSVLPPFTLPIGGGLPLSYRFGSFSGDRLHVNGREYPDDRTRNPAWIREYLEDPFAALCEPPVERKAFDRLLARFPVYEVLAQGGKGGIFAAFDLEAGEFHDLILKVGIRHGQILPDGRDGMDLLRHERDIFARLAGTAAADIVPRMRGYHEFGDRNVLVLDRIEGADLLKRKLDGTLTRAHLSTALSALSRIHKAGLYVGDPKLANFIADTEGRIWAVDFESAGEIAHVRPDPLCTFHFSRPRITGVTARERIHLMYSALHPIEERSFSETDRIIDLIDFVRSCEPADAIEVWALEELKRELVNVMQAAD